jgi:hypothetical protein
MKKEFCIWEREESDVLVRDCPGVQDESMDKFDPRSPKKILSSPGLVLDSSLDWPPVGQTSEILERKKEKERYAFTYITMHNACV